MAEDIKEKIINFLKNTNKTYNVKELAVSIGVSYPTVLKWVEVLKAENKVDVQDYGNVKLVSLKNKNSEEEKVENLE